MASTTSKPPSKPVQALIVYNRYCWCADEVCVIVLSLRYYYMHFLQSCQYGVLLFSVLKVVQGGRTRTMVIAVYWLDLFVHSNFQQVGWVSDWFPYTVSETKVYGNLAGN